jgi:hypothetical protein
MKTIINPQLLRLCANAILCSPPLSWVLQFHSAYFLLPALKRLLFLERKRLKARLRQVVASALREILAILHALACSATVNMRIYAGLVMVWVLAPLASCIYQLYNPTADMDPGWYHINGYYFFHALGPYISLFIGLVGLYFVFPPSRRTFLISVPTIGWAIAKIIKIILCTSNDDWHANISIPVFIAGVCSSMVLLISVDWFAWRKYHKFDGNMCRLEGLVSISSMPEKEKQILKNEIKKAKDFAF